MIDTTQITRAFERYRDGRFRIEQRVGHGGMGTVFKADDSMLRRPCAIKVLDPSFLDNAQVVARFEREARVMIQIEHHAIVRVFDLDRIEGMPFIVLEWIGGGTLSQFCPVGKDEADRSRRLSTREAVSVMIRVCEGIEAAHAKGIIHRDIKPANILLAPSGPMKDGMRECSPKVTDFGIAKVESGNTHLTSEGSGMGSLGFLAPEQTNAAATVGPTADVHALGVTLWALLKGDERAPGFFHASVTSPKYPQFLAAIARPLCDTILRATAMHADDRYQTVTDMRAALLAILHSTTLWGQQTSPFSDVEEWTGGPDEFAMPRIRDIAYEATGFLRVSDFPGRPAGLLEQDRVGTPSSVGAPSSSNLDEAYAQSSPTRVDRPHPVVPDTVMGSNGEIISLSSSAQSRRDPVHERQLSWRRILGFAAAVLLGGVLALTLWRFGGGGVTEDVVKTSAVAVLPESTVPPEASKPSPAESTESAVPAPEAGGTPKAGSAMEMPTVGDASDVPDKAVAKKHKAMARKKHKVTPPHDAVDVPPPADQPPLPPPATAIQTDVRVRVKFWGGEKVAVWLVGQGGRRALPTSVAPGTYQVIGEFPSGEKSAMPELIVKEGTPVLLTCSVPFERCQAK